MGAGVPVVACAGAGACLGVSACVEVGAGLRAVVGLAVGRAVGAARRRERLVSALVALSAAAPSCSRSLPVLLRARVGGGCGGCGVRGVRGVLCVPAVELF